MRSVTNAVLLLMSAVMASIGGNAEAAKHTVDKVKSARRLSMTESEQERLHGRWETVMVHRDGKPVPKQVGAEVVFTGNRIAIETDNFEPDSDPRG